MENMLICDDNKKVGQMVGRDVRSVFQKHGLKIEITIYTDPREALRYCKNIKVSYVLLDIDMPEMTGFELSKELMRLPEKMAPVVLFMSSLEQLVFEAFSYRPFDFLRKSHMKEEIEKKIGRLIREFAYHNEQIELVQTEDACVFLKNVFYFKSDRNTLDAYTEDGVYRCRGNISAMEEKYPNSLIRTHQSYLVNAEYIARINGDCVRLRNGNRVKLSRYRRTVVEQKYRKWSNSQK